MATPRTTRGLRPVAALARRRDAARRWFGQDDRALLTGLVLVTLVGAWLTYRLPSAFTGANLMVPLLLADMVLSPRRIPGFVGFVTLVLVVESALEFDDGFPTRRWVTILLVLAMAGVVALVAARRARLGVGGMTGESMLLDLQGRLNRQGRLPELPPGWHAEAATRPAGGTSFAGDFVVAHLDDAHLSLVLTDVSGKGVDAGTRSLLLSGAFGALLGSVPPAGFLVEANAFLLRQEWGEGFATAVHLCLDLDTGGFEIRSAGHPPVVHLVAGSGAWDLHDRAEGPVLGLVEDAAFVPVTGRLGHGDALLLYTDGLVEQPRRDIGQGIDRLVGECERLLGTGFRGAAQGLVERLGAPGDDCALLIIQRT